MTVLLLKSPSETRFDIDRDAVGSSVETVGSANELLTRLEAGDVHVVILGPGVDGPIRVAQRVRAFDESMAVLILAPSDRIERLAQAADDAPFVGERVVCRASEDNEGILRTLRHALAQPRDPTRKSGDRVTPVTLSTMRYLDRILEHGSTGVLICNRGGVIVSLNRRANEMLGTPEHDALGAPLKKFFPKGQLESMLRVSEGPRVIERTHADGTTRSLELRGASLKEGPEHVAYVLLLEDLTEQRKAEASLARAYEDLKRMHKLQVNLLSMVSHDIRAPLGVIVGAINELSSKDVGLLNKDQEFLVVLVRRSVERLTRLASNLVFLARMETGRIELTRTRTDLRPLVKRVSEDAQRIDAGANTVVEIALPDAPLEADVDTERFGQLLTNLLSNAVRFARKSVRVRLAIDGDDALLEVTDDGPGIPEEAIESIFERFSRVEAPKSGTGLGLAIVRAIVTSHRGNVRAENLKGFDGKPSGARFTVRIPRRAPSA